MSQTPPFKVFSGTNSRYLAEKICNSLGCELGQMNIQHFADGEFAVSFEESIRGCQVYLVQSTFPNSDNLMELLLMIDAAKRASAKSIVAVVPYFGWARQDRKDKPRVSIAAKLLADILSVAGINRLITMDLHADQIQGFFDVPVDHLYASSVFIPYIQSLKLKDMVVATPDVGGSKRASTYAKYLGVPLVLCHKQRANSDRRCRRKECHFGRRYGRYGRDDNQSSRFNDEQRSSFGTCYSFSCRDERPCQRTGSKLFYDRIDFHG